MSCFIPNVIGGIVFPKELLSHLVILSDGGGSVVQVLSDVVGGSSLIRGGRDERSSGSVERHGDEGRFVRGEDGCVDCGSGKRDDERKRPRNLLSYIHSNQWNDQKGKTITHYSLKPQRGQTSP
jgi:hypothetical protein